MNQVNLAKIRDLAEQLTIVAGTFQMPPSLIRVQQIRKADKSLIVLEAFFTPTFLAEAQQWKTAVSGAQVLKQKILLFQKKQKALAEIDRKLAELYDTTHPWLSLGAAQRQEILENFNRAFDFIKEDKFETEGNLLSKFEKFIKFDCLVPYAKNLDHLCNALYHFQNIDKYSENIEELKQKKVKGLERLKTVKRGFFLALFLCFFLVTIPLTLPFAINLMGRKQQIEKQIANIDEAIKKEQKRLEAAEEGAVVSQEIQDLIGVTPLEETRFILTEVLHISEEFDAQTKNLDDTKILLMFFKDNIGNLENLFPNMPENIYSIMQWFTQNIIKMQENEALITQLSRHKNDILNEQKLLTKGHEIGTLNKSLIHLDNLSYGAFRLELTEETKMYFYEICESIELVLKKARTGLFFISKGFPIDEKDWQETHTLLRSVLNIISLCLMETDLDAASPVPLHLNPGLSLLKDEPS